jgi:hypothetical protein
VGAPFYFERKEHAQGAELVAEIAWKKLQEWQCDVRVSYKDIFANVSFGGI